jgi:hypothetical protein
MGSKWFHHFSKLIRGLWKAVKQNYNAFFSANGWLLCVCDANSTLQGSDINRAVHREANVFAVIRTIEIMTLF